MRVIILYEPDETCVDPRDDSRTLRRHYDEPSTDVLVLWRDTHGDPDAGGHPVWHAAAGGIFEHLEPALVRTALAVLDIEA